MFTDTYWRSNGLISAREASALYGVKPDTLRHWRVRGHLLGIQAGNGRVYFYRRDVEEILSSRLPGLLKESF